MINTIIHIPDIHNEINRWIIEADLGAMFTIVAEKDKRYISHIGKDKVYIKDGFLYSDEIRNPFCTIENARYSKAEFGVIWLED